VSHRGAIWGGDNNFATECFTPRVGVNVAKGRVSIVVERCKACGFCVEFCPTKVLALSSAFNSKGYHPPHVVQPDKCSGCDLCGMYCPDFAINGYKTTPAKSEPEVEDEG
jgi:2-oxoglutarate ferredoxin oxidoreductase subunit delta